MRILLVQDYLRVGGTERQTLFLAQFFKTRGHTVKVLVFRPGGLLSRGVLAEGVEVESLFKKDWKIESFAFGLTRAAKNFEADRIICMGRVANCYAGLIQKRFPQMTVIATLRTGKMLLPMHSWALGVVTAVLVNSNWWKRRMLERGFSAERIHVVHNSSLLFHDREEDAAERKRIRTAAGVSEDSIIFVNVANFRSGKRHMDLIRMFSRLREENPELDCRLWLVGDGRERKKCARWAAHQGLGTRIRFWGHVSNPKPYYAASDVAVSASREDSLPNFLVEAQAMNLPLIAYDFRGVTECCNPGKTGEIVKMGDDRHFIASMKHLATDRGFRAEAAAAAGPWASAHFSTERQAEAILRFLESFSL